MAVSSKSDISIYNFHGWRRLGLPLDYVGRHIMDPKIRFLNYSQKKASIPCLVLLKLYLCHYLNLI